MKTPEPASASPEHPIRLWPGVVAVLLQWFAWLVIPQLVPGTRLMGYALAGGSLLGGLAVVLWWAFGSRAPRPERVGALLLMPAAFVAAKGLLHPSMASASMLYVLHGIPLLCLAFVLAVALSRRMKGSARRLVLAASILIATFGWTLVRIDGVTGDFALELAWRFTPTAEERLMAQGGVSAQGAAAQTAAGEEWPGFRGPARDGVVRGVPIATDWTTSPPVELWRRPVGPGWSSFAVRGNRVFTQEQRGEDELVTCYDAATGQPVWAHRDAARFWEAIGGAGPRGTPTLAGERLFTLGATGILNALDAVDGRLLWSRNLVSDTEVKVPDWGFSSSPLVLGDLVVVAASGRLAAYDAGTGEGRWKGPKTSGSYTSPHFANLGGVEQILMTNGKGITSFAPQDGSKLWEHAWPGITLMQPAFTSEGDVLVNASEATGGVGTRRLALSHGGSGWGITERLTSNGLKPYFNDIVVHEGYAYGLDGRILAAINLETGERAWKGGRYGHGQLLLLPEQDLLLVLSEEGELALVEAVPEGYTELARRPAITGKTWNHPALVGDLLLVRNGQEMAAFRLPRQEGSAGAVSR